MGHFGIWPCIAYHHMEDPQDSGIPVWMKGSIGACVIIMREYHDVGMCPWVDGILSMTDIICCVVYVKHPMLVDVILADLHCLALFICEILFITIVCKP